jgi:C-terminal processing protease CtpA/Prc
MFIGALKGQSNVTVVGEETGGGSYGNSAMLIPSIVLPHSRLRISLPLYRVVLHKGGEKGCGIMPDVLVPPSSNAIAEGKDVKIEKVYEMIKNRKLIEN